MITSLEDFKAYNLTMEVGEEVWAIVARWGYFENDTVGKQFAKAVDSIAANLSEGLERYHYRETKKFAYHFRGSLFETKTWLAKSVNRKLVSDKQGSTISSRLEILGKMINAYINSIGDVNEPFIPYLLEDDKSNAQFPIPTA